MSLVDDLIAMSRKPGQPCHLSAFLATLPADQQTELVAAFQNPRVSSEVLAAYMRTTHGIPGEANVYKVHRNRGCDYCAEATGGLFPARGAG